MKKFFGIIYDWLMMAVGCAVFSVAIAVFLEPSGSRREVQAELP